MMKRHVYSIYEPISSHRVCFSSGDHVQKVVDQVVEIVNCGMAPELDGDVLAFLVTPLETEQAEVKLRAVHLSNVQIQ